ncbi:astacin-like metalloprotease toxin 1 [Stegodyphus dumicola]|uniref:astacin-like metalloprotease toxin 1 n=1 Tax=Stegodyphus dumicola TaxID=202533 RepID=UPI0015B2A420|nr:astacin-like metalloprotease toxin 1 [Stegodyphus dumicola]
MEKMNLFFVLLTFYYIYAEEIAENEGEVALENPNLFEGDILRSSFNNDRNAVVAEKRKWPNARIPYTIDSKLKKQESLIKEAMDHYANKTCIRFVPRKDEKQYVNILKGKSCYSHVGRTSRAQPLSLGPKCYKFGIIVHELGHAVGFFHEHSRSDRDDYINIHYENIQPGN